MNGQVCCILGICCPPESEERVTALATAIQADTRASHATARKQAEWILKHFALAPKSLEPFILDIVKHAKH